MSCTEHYCKRIIEEFNQDYKTMLSNRLGRPVGTFDGLKIHKDTVAYAVVLGEQFYYSDTVFDPTKSASDNATFLAIALDADYDDVLKRIEKALD